MAAAKRARAPRGDSAATWVRLSTLKPWAANPKKPDADAVGAVADSLREFGWGRTLVARSANQELVIGHRSWAAAQLLIQQWGEASPTDRKKWHPDAKRTALEGVAPCRFVDLAEKKAHALALADNRLNELGEWDDQLLADALKEFDEDERELIGWTEEDFEDLLEELDEKPKAKKKARERAGGDHHEAKLADVKKAVKALAPCVARAAEARQREKAGSASVSFGLWREILRELEGLKGQRK